MKRLLFACLFVHANFPKPNVFQKLIMVCCFLGMLFGGKNPSKEKKVSLRPISLEQSTSSNSLSSTRDSIKLAKDKQVQNFESLEQVQEAIQQVDNQKVNNENGSDSSGNSFDFDDSPTKVHHSIPSYVNMGAQRISQKFKHLSIKFIKILNPSKETDEKSKNSRPHDKEFSQFLKLLPKHDIKPEELWSVVQGKSPEQLENIEQEARLKLHKTFENYENEKNSIDGPKTVLLVKQILTIYATRHLYVPLYLDLEKLMNNGLDIPIGIMWDVVKTDSDIQFGKKLKLNKDNASLVVFQNTLNEAVQRKNRKSVEDIAVKLCIKLNEISQEYHKYTDKPEEDTNQIEGQLWWLINQNIAFVDLGEDNTLKNIARRSRRFSASFERYRKKQNKTGSSSSSNDSSEISSDNLSTPLSTNTLLERINNSAVREKSEPSVVQVVQQMLDLGYGNQPYSDYETDSSDMSVKSDEL